LGFVVFKIIAIIIAGLLAFLVYKYTTTQSEAVTKNKELGKLFLTNNTKEEGVKTTASGLQYLVLSPGGGTQYPKANDSVKVHYHGSLINGMVFDSSVERGQPISFGLNQVIKGWTEGLQLMVVGEKTRFFIPSELAYGNRSAGAIPPASTLIFDVELLAIN
jgi:peptidylprolyl isomerase